MAVNPTKAKKPKKPRPDFPLFPHARGYWAKKVRGKMRYFGPWADPDRAVALWKAQQDDLLAGREPSVTEVDDDGKPVLPGITVKYLCDAFLTSKGEARDAGELTVGTFRQYLRACMLMADTFGRNRVASDLKPTDFAKLKTEARKGRGVPGVDEKVRLTRGVFKWAYESGLIERPVVFGPDFKQATAADRRKQRQRQRAEHGPKLFTAKEINAMLAEATPSLRAMILLGINCGFGATDCSDLRTNHIDLKARTLDCPRRKTGIPRRAVLWPETVKALRVALEQRHEPKGDTPDNSVFVTHHGNTFTRTTDKGTRIDSVGMMFNKLAEAVGAKRARCGFYGLRATFQTEANKAGDIQAARLIMGHEDEGDMTARYTQAIGDDRLKAVTDHVRKWLKPKTTKKKPSK